MKTVVMESGVPFALMEGVDGKDADGKAVPSQISLWSKRNGDFAVQHIAFQVKDVVRLAKEWRRRGVRFLTEDSDGNVVFLSDIDRKGNTIIQCFTFPLCPGASFLSSSKL
ncbi:hypothetical protein L0Y41_00785 [bacterium]|nr:hypothetical protein [bacterium]